MKLTHILVCILAVAGAALGSAQIKISAKSPVGVLKMKRVADDLQLTSEQRDKVNKLDLDYMTSVKDIQTSGFSDIEDLKTRIAETSARIEKQVKNLLTEAQLMRRTELVLQLGGPATMLEEPYAEKLKLSDTQRSNIESIVDSFLEEMREIQQSAQTTDEISVKRNQATKAYREKAEKTLNEEQLKTLATLKGKLLAETQ
jgi:hypothetical protein